MPHAEHWAEALGGGGAGEREADGSRARERKSGIDGAHEAVTAGRPHSLMDDKCSVAVTVRIPPHISVNSVELNREIWPFGFN